MNKILPVFVLLVMLLSACESQKKGYLVGKWEEISRETTPVYKYIWTFKDDSNFEIEQYLVENNSLIITIQGQYNFRSQSMKYMLELILDEGNFSGAYPVEGDYWVDEIDRTIMLITREKFLENEEGSPFLRREFLKL